MCLLRRAGNGKRIERFEGEGAKGEKSAAAEFIVTSKSHIFEILAYFWSYLCEKTNQKFFEKVRD